MNAAFQFDDQSDLWAIEIHHERANRVLTAEVQAFQVPSAQELPEDALAARLTPS